MEEKFYVTAEGLKELQEEYERLVHQTRNEVIEELKAARAQGDLSENADYDAARDHQAQVESRIKEVENMIRNAEVIEGKKGAKVVKLGSTVVLEEQDTGNELEYTIVGTVEADPLNGKLSNATPLAEAIMNKKVGAIVKVDVDKPYDVKIVKIS